MKQLHVQLDVSRYIDKEAVSLQRRFVELVKGYSGYQLKNSDFDIQDTQILIKKGGLVKNSLVCCREDVEQDLQREFGSVMQIVL